MEIVQCPADQLRTGCQLALNGQFLVDFVKLAGRSTMGPIHWDVWPADLLIAGSLLVWQAHTRWVKYQPGRSVDDVVDSGLLV